MRSRSIQNNSVIFYADINFLIFSSSLFVVFFGPSRMKSFTYFEHRAKYVK